MRLPTFLILSATFAGFGSACGTDILVHESAAGADNGRGGEYVYIDPVGQGGATPSNPEPTTPDLPRYDDPGCEDELPPIEAFECDPYAQHGGDCAPGEGCYIFVDYPSDKCDQEVYGSFCAPAGSGRQGDPCSVRCAPGHVCVITGAGTQCVQLCNLEGASGCPAGYVCEAIDVQGFGGCL